MQIGRVRCKDLYSIIKLHHVRLFISGFSRDIPSSPSARRPRARPKQAAPRPQANQITADDPSSFFCTENRPHLTTYPSLTALVQTTTPFSPTTRSNHGLSRPLRPAPPVAHQDADARRYLVRQCRRLPQARPEVRIAHFCGENPLRLPEERRRHDANKAHGSRSQIEATCFSLIYGPNGQLAEIGIFSQPLTG